MYIHTLWVYNTFSNLYIAFLGWQMKKFLKSVGDEQPTSKLISKFNPSFF